MSEIHALVEGVCGRITLNRPAAINALSLDMVRAMYRALTDWATNPAIQFVIVDGAGDRGLCAGGDIRALYTSAIAGNFDAAAAFFGEEYRLNYLISRYPKPYIALMDGIVMGGGIGISSHGSHRIVTEHSVLAMPETNIGFIPDVGGTYLLGNAPEESGTWMALTGARINAADAILCGLADFFVPHDSLASLLSRLKACTESSAIDSCVRGFTAEPPKGTFADQRGWINECFAASSVEEILQALKSRTEEAARTAAGGIARNSPTSLKVTLHALRKAREYKALRPCLQQEYTLALACLRHGDFIEGVRAAVVDKDRKPVWQPGRLEEVTEGQVQTFFNGPDVLDNL